MSKNKVRLYNKQLGFFVLLLLVIELSLILFGNSFKITPGKTVKEISFQEFRSDYLNSDKVITLVTINNFFVEGHINKTPSDLQTNPDMAPDFYFNIDSLNQILRITDSVKNIYPNSRLQPVLFEMRSTHLLTMLQFIVRLIPILIIILLILMLSRITKKTTK